MTGARTGRSFKLSAGGLILGVFLGILYLGFLVVLPRVALSFLSRTNLNLSSDSFSLVNSETYLVLIIALVIAEIAQRAVKEPLTVKGLLKIVVGILTGVFYYLVLNGGGVISLLATFSSFSFVVSITLLITLVLLELSVVAKVLQGVFEIFEGRRMNKPASVVGGTQVGPPNLPPVTQNSDLL
jgi:hypothetical protein